MKSDTSVRERLSRLRKKIPGTAKQDGIAGLTGAIGSVPDGLAAGILAGVNPIYGLYGSIAGPIAGGLLSSTQLMLVTTTSAAALATSDSLSGLSAGEKAGALFLLTTLVGVIQVIAGFLQLGRFVRFVSHSVMVGFLSGIAVLIVLGQIPTIVGFEDPEGANKITQTVDVLRHIGEIDLASLAVGAATLALAVVLPQTRLRSIGTLFALLIPSLLVILLDVSSVGLVEDVSDIPDFLPLPQLPSLDYASLDVTTGAIAIAIIVLVQGAGVSQAAQNPDGTPSEVSRDFTAQGAANVASGLFQGMPVGGSVSQTALNVQAGARTRWAAISSGIWMIVLVGLLSAAVAKVAMPTLAALLILAGARTIDWSGAVSVWHVGWGPRLTILVTFIATLLLPIQIAVGLGIALSALIHISSAATDVKVVELIELPDGQIEEREPPEQLPSRALTVLNIHGSLFFAGAWTVQSLLPSTRGSRLPALVIRMHGRARIGATFVEILEEYARDIEAAGGRLYVTGVSKRVHGQLKASNVLRRSGLVAIYPASTVLGEATRMAMDDARVWLTQRGESGSRVAT